MYFSKIRITDGTEDETVYARDNNAVHKDTLRFANVLDYGAVGDGTTDDSAAFVAAANTGYPVYVPKGTFVVSERITLTSAGMFGVGMGSVVKLINTGDFYSNVWRCNIKNLRIDAMSKTTDNTNYAIHALGVANWVENVIITGYGSGIKVDGAGSRIINCEVQVAKNGIYVVGNDTSIVITDCLIRLLAGLPSQSSGTNGIVIEGGNAALTISNTAVLLFYNAVSITGEIFSLRISECWLDNCYHCIVSNTHAQYDIVINGTWFSSESDCIWINGPWNGLEIDNCVFYRYGSNCRAIVLGQAGQSVLRNAVISNTAFSCRQAFVTGVDTVVDNVIINGCVFGGYRNWPDLNDYMIVLASNGTVEDMLIANCSFAKVAKNIAGHSEDITLANNIGM